MTLLVCFHCFLSWVCVVRFNCRSLSVWSSGIVKVLSMDQFGICYSLWEKTFHTRPCHLCVSWLRCVKELGLLNACETELPSPSGFCFVNTFLCYVRSRTEDLVISAKVVLQYVMHLHKLLNGFLIVIWFLFCCCCCCTQVWFSVQDGEDYILLSASRKLCDAWARWHRANYCHPSGSWCPWPVHTSWHLWAYSEGGWWTS